MKKVFIPLFLITMSLAASSQDYYWYSGQQIPLERGCRQYIIYENDLLQESDKAQIAYSEDVSYEGYTNLKWGYTRPNAKIEDTAHVHYRSISYKKNGDYYDNMFVTHRFYVMLKSKGDLSLLQEMAAQNHAEIEKGDSISLWYILRCQLDPPHNALELANMFYETGSFAYVEPEFSNAIELDPKPGIKSLCDEWNMLVEPFMCDGPYCDLSTTIFRLTTDTIINAQTYVKLEMTEKMRTTYRGALREGTNHDIYFIPAESSHEYLMYAFNAQVGDRLTNLWIGGVYYECPDGYSGTVTSISDGMPRIFTIDIDCIEDGSIPPQTEWIEGVGFTDNPTGKLFFLGAAVDYGVETILCAYKDGEQVYASELSKKYGCQFNGIINLDESQTDTMPEYQKLFIGEWMLYKYLILSPHPSGYDTATHTMSDSQCFSTLYINDQELYWVQPCENSVYGASTYTLQEQINGTWMLTMHSSQDQQETVDVTILKLTRNEMEWYKIDYDYGDNERQRQDTTKMPGYIYYYFMRVGTQDNDTLPLYIKDGPGTSTVEPVDPNQIVATLVGDMLSIYEYIGAEIGYKLTKASPGNNMPARGKEMADDTFSESVSIQLKERGLYTLELTNPEWGYTIFGTFEYDGMQGIEPVETGVPAAQKILRNGQLFIQKGDRIYTVQGIEIRE